MERANNTYFNRIANEETKHFLWGKLFIYLSNEFPRVKSSRGMWGEQEKKHANDEPVLALKKQLYVVTRSLKMVLKAVIKVCLLFTSIMTANDVHK